MGKQIRNIVIGLVIAVGGIVGLGAIGLTGFNQFFLPVLFGFFAWYILSNLANNRKVATVPDAERANLLATPPPPGYGILYIYREGFVGKALGVDVLVDGYSVAQLKSPRFVRVVVPAGQHIVSTGLKGFIGAQNNNIASPVWVEDAGVTIVLVSIDMGMLKNQVNLRLDANPAQTLQRFGTIPMVRAEVPQPPSLQVPYNR